MTKNYSAAITTFSIMVGIVVSLLSYFDSKNKDIEARKFEASQPFLELRQKLYLEALNAASVIATQNYHTDDEIKKAKARFAELYWGELSLVEDSAIESKMVRLERTFHLFEGENRNAMQDASIVLAHAMRQSLINSWKIDTVKVGIVNN